MSNKTQLQTNNASLDDYIARINAAKDVAATLPEAGGGGTTVEAFTGTVCGPTSGDDDSLTFIYTDDTLTHRSINVERDNKATITVAANTVICCFLDDAYSVYETADIIYYDAHSASQCFYPIANNFVF